jgi:hypothetical protein
MPNKDKTFEPRSWSKEDIEKTVSTLEQMYKKGFTVGTAFRVINNHRIIKRSPDAIRKKLHQFGDKYFVKENPKILRGRLGWGRYFSNQKEVSKSSNN